MRTIALLLVALAAGCGSAPKENFYTLSGPQAPPPAASANAISVHVGPVLVPEQVDRLPMVIRTSPNRVDINEGERWAEPLKSAIPRVVAENLMRELGTPRVTGTRLGSSQPADYRVALEVQRFDSSLDQGAAVDVLWTITPAKGGAPRTGRTSVVEPAASRDPAGLAAAHSRALEKVAREIAAELRR